VVAQREIECLRSAPAAHFDVRGLIEADWHVVHRQVRHCHQQRRELGLDRVEPLGRVLQFAADATDLGHRRRRVFALGLRLPDLLGKAVAARLQLFGPGLNGLALRLERGEARDVEERLRRFAPLQTSDDLRQILAQQIDVEHGLWLREAQPVRHWSADCRQCAGR